MALHINYAECYIERFTVTLCSEMLVSLYAQPTYRYASEKTSAPVYFTLRRLNSPTHNDREQGDYKCKTLDMGTGIPRCVYCVLGVHNKSNISTTQTSHSYFSKTQFTCPLPTPHPPPLPPPSQPPPLPPPSQPPPLLPPSVLVDLRWELFS